MQLVLENPLPVNLYPVFPFLPASFRSIFLFSFFLLSFFSLSFPLFSLRYMAIRERRWSRAQLIVARKIIPVALLFREYKIGGNKIEETLYNDVYITNR